MNKGWSMKKFLNNMILAIALVGCFALVGCAKSDSYGNTSVDKYNWFYRIEGTPMVYDKDNQVVYYKDRAGHQGYMAPYYNEHGRLCRYVDGQIVPIE